VDDKDVQAQFRMRRRTQPNPEVKNEKPWVCECGECSYNACKCVFKAALEAKDEPVAWGASALSKPEYIAEQKEKTSQLRNMMDEFVQTIPNFDQLQQIVNNLERCLTRDSKHEFLRVWIRDWTEHKLSKHTPPQRTWVGLTNEDLEFLFPHGKSVWLQETVKIIEAKLKAKNS
jgi:hypothetical protein